MNPAKTVRNSAVAAKKVAVQELDRVRKSASEQLGVPTAEVGGQAENAPFGQVPEQDQAAAFEQTKIESNARDRQLLAELEAKMKQIREQKAHEQVVKSKQEQQEAAVQQQEEVKKETAFQRAVKGIKRRIAGKREMKQGPSG